MWCQISDTLREQNQEKTFATITEMSIKDAAKAGQYDNIYNKWCHNMLFWAHCDIFST